MIYIGSGVAGQGAGNPQAFGEPSAPTINVFANVPAFRLHSDQVRLENLDIRCNTTTADCLDFFSQPATGFADISLVNVNAGMGTGSTGTAVDFDCSAALSGGNGCFGIAILGGVYFVNSTAPSHASVILRDCGQILVGDPMRRMTLFGYGILIQDDGSVAGAGLSHIQNILTEGLTGAVITEKVASAGGGINSIASRSRGRCRLRQQLFHYRCQRTCGKRRERHFRGKFFGRDIIGRRLGTCAGYNFKK